MRRRFSKLRPQALLNQTLFTRNGDGSRTPPQSQSPSSPASPPLESPTSSLPFSGSTRKEDTFYVDLEEPHRQYNPGDVIKGSVIFVVHRDIKLDSIRCGMHGSINIKNPLVKTKISKHKLFDDTITLWGKEPKQKGKAKAKDSDHPSSSDGNGTVEGDSRETGRSSRSDSTGSLDDNGSVSENGQVINTLPRGRHVFKFEFEMPTKNVFSGVEFERGDISYHISASYFKHGATVASKVTQQSVTVIVPNNVGILPRPKPTCLSVEVRRKKKPAGVISAVLELRHRGYLRGESIPIKITVKHIRALRSVSGAIVTLSRISRVTAVGSEPQTFRKDISQMVTPLFTDPNSYTATISTSVKIPPDTFPTTKGLDVVSFQYYIEVVLDLGGHFEKQRRETDQYDAAKHGMLDTDKISSRRGFVNLWADVIVGTFRSEEDPQWQRVSSPYPESIGTTSLRNGSSVHGAISLNSDSVASSSNVFDSEVPSYQEQMALHRPSDEKQRQRAYEQALLPSAPDGEFSFVPATAPALHHAHLDGPQVNGHADKAELEREHLEALASQPEEDDYVPQYQPSLAAGPSAPSLPPIHDAPETYADNNDDDDDDLYTVSRRAMPTVPPVTHSDGASAPIMHTEEEPTAPPLPSESHLTNS